MTTDLNLQNALEALASARPAQDRGPQEQVVTFASAIEDGKSPGWDPHEVWLHRIKKPREDRRVE